jgi:DNA repair exonuclease SbcCD ATPase subunit
VKFNFLQIENFLTIGQGQVNLADRGLNVIQGENADDGSATSNGAGKSSIVDALSWVLYGTTARGVKGDAVVNRKAGKGTRVEVVFDAGESRYIVVRHRKHKEHKNQLHVFLDGDTPTSLDKGTEAETQKLLEEILGCSHGVFVAAVYSGQEAMPDLPNMSDRDLKRLIEEAAGMQRIEAAYTVARSRFNLLATELSNQNTRVGMLGERLETHKVSLNHARDDAKQWDAELGTKVANLTEGVKTAEANFESRRIAAREARETLDRVAVTEPRIKEQLAAYSELQKAVTAAEQRSVALDRAVDRAALVLAKRQIEQSEKAIADAASTIGQPCKECGKPHTEDDLGEYLVAQRRQLEERKKEAVTVSARVRAQLDEANAAKAAAQKLKDDLPDVAVLMRDLKSIQDYRALSNAKDSDAVLAEQELERRRGSLADHLKAANPHLAQITRHEANVAESEAASVEAKLKQAELQRRADVAAAVVKVFGPAGVRAQILDTVTPYLNARTSDYLSVLSDGAITAVWTTLTKDSKGDLKEKFTIDVTHAHGADSFTGLSGGEKRKVRLATALGLQDLVASRAVQPIDLWIGDEVDDALDPAGLERLMTLLERKARERGTVLVISHNELTDWCDQVTTVTKKDGLSVIDGALVAP